MKKTTKFLTVILALGMMIGIFAALGITVGAAEVASGTSGDVSWSLDSEGTLTVSGEGAMADYTNGSQPWYAHKDSIKTVIVTKGVTSISTNAFSGFLSLATVKIAGSVTAIGNNAFYSCENLSTVEYYGSSNPVADSTVFFGSYVVAKVLSSYSGNVFCGKMTIATLDAANEPLPPAPPCDHASHTQSGCTACGVTDSSIHSFENGFCSVCDGYEPAVLNGDYYEIDNAGKLFWFADKVNNDNQNFGTANAILTADIDANPGYVFYKNGSVSKNGSVVTEGWRAWTPIAQLYGTYYYGHFNGNNHTVSGLYTRTVSNTDVSPSIATAFMGNMGKYSVLENLGVLNSYFACFKTDTGSGHNLHASGLVYRAYASEKNGIPVIRNCFSMANVYAYASASGIVANGVAMSSVDYAVFVENCFFGGYAEGHDNNYGLGDVVGCAVTDNIKVTNCYYIPENLKVLQQGEQPTGGGGIAVSQAQMANGHLAYHLGGVFGQNLDNGGAASDYPVLGGAKVYRNGICSAPTYSNTEGTFSHDASFVDGEYYDSNGLCLICGTQAAASLIVDGTATYYMDFPSAINAAKAAAAKPFIKLLDNVTLTEKISIRDMTLGMELDFAGKVIYYAQSSPITWSYDNGTLTLRDSLGGGGFTSGRFDALETYSPVEIYGGNFRASVDDNNTQAGAISTATDDAKVSIHGGVFYSTDSALLVNGGEVNIYGGSFSGEGTTFDLRGGSIQVHSAEFPEGISEGTTYPRRAALLSKVIAPDCYFKNSEGKLIFTVGDVYAVDVACTVSKGADLSEYGVIYVADGDYNGEEQAPAVYVNVDGRTVDPANYTVSYSNNVNAGDNAIVAVVGKDDYTGETSRVFTIRKAILTEDSFSFDTLDFTYNFDPQNVSVNLPTGLDAQYVTVGYMKDGSPLESAPEDAGKYKVVVSVVGSPNHDDAFFNYDMTIAPAPVEVYIDPTAEFIFDPDSSHTPDVAVEMNGGLPFNPTEYGGTLKYEDNYNAGTATVTVGGNFVGSTTFEIAQATPIVELGAPLTSVLAGYVMDLNPTANVVDNIGNTPIALTVLDGEGYSVSGNRITIDEGVVIGSTITVLVEYPGSTNYEKTVTEHTITVGVPEVNTTELENKITELNELVDGKASAAEITSAVEELEGLIAEAKAAANDYTDGKAGELNAAIEAAKTSVTNAYTAAIEAAKDELYDAINDSTKADAYELAKAVAGLEGAIANAEEAARKYAENQDAALKAELDSTIEDAKKELTNGYTAAIEAAKAELNKALIDGDKALDEKIVDLTAALDGAKVALEQADADNKAELVKKIDDADKLLDDAIKAVQKNLDDAKAELNKALTDGDKALDKKIVDLTAALDGAKAALEGADADNKAELQKSIADGDAALMAAVNKVADDLVKAEMTLGAKDEELTETVDELKTALIVAFSVAGVGVAGNVALLTWMLVSRRKSTPSPNGDES